MVTREILASHPVTTLRKEISKTNIKGYSGMKKSEIIELMMKHKERFGHIQMKGKSAPSKKSKPERVVSFEVPDVSGRVRRSKDVKPMTKTKTEGKPSYKDMEIKFFRIKKLFHELTKGLNQGQLKSFRNDVDEYLRTQFNFNEDDERLKIKKLKTQAQRDYNKLLRIFLGRTKPVKDSKAQASIKEVTQMIKNAKKSRK